MPKSGLGKICRMCGRCILYTCNRAQIEWRLVLYSQIIMLSTGMSHLIRIGSGVRKKAPCAFFRISVDPTLDCGRTQNTSECSSRVAIQ